MGPPGDTGRPDGGRNLHLKPLDGSTSDEPLLTLGVDRLPTSWSSDGKVILFEEGPNNDQRDMWTLRLPERTPTRFLATEFNERWGRFSPDGRWVSYVTNRSGRDEVRVCRFPGCTDAVTISSNGGVPSTKILLLSSAYNRLTQHAHVALKALQHNVNVAVVVTPDPGPERSVAVARRRWLENWATGLRRGSRRPTAHGTGL